MDTWKNEFDFKSKYGTNIFFKPKGSKMNAKDVFLNWYDKRNSYIYKDEENNPSETGEFMKHIYILSLKFNVVDIFSV